jgi:hypothetical protein
MRSGGARVTLLPLLALAAACSSRVAVRPVVGSGGAAPTAEDSTRATGDAAPDEAALRQQLAARDREIVQLRSQVEEAQARENDMRASLEEATRKLGGDAADASRGRFGSAAVSAQGTDAGDRPDVVLAALRAALSQEQERREIVENQLNRLKEETSATYIGPRVPEADYLAIKQELVLLRQSLEDERAARERLASATPPTKDGAAVDPAVQAAVAESADLRVRLRNLQEERDSIVAALNNNLMTSQRRVTELEQQLGAARAATTQAEAAAAANGMSAENTTLRTLLDEERRRTQALTAKLKLAARVNDLIFKLQAQQAEANRVRTRREEP